MRISKIYPSFILGFLSLSLSISLNADNQIFTQADTDYTERAYVQLLEAKQYQSILEKSEAERAQNLDDASPYFWAAQAHMGLKNYKDSVENAAQAVIKAPEVSEHYRLLADAEVLKQLGAENTSIIRLPGLARRTKRNYQTAISLDPNNLKAREGLGLYYLLAPGLVGGSLKKAKVQADAIAKIDMNRAMSFYIGIEKKRKKWAKALALVEQWERDEPNLWKPREDRFRIHFEQKQYEQAAQVLLKHLEKNPNEMDANYLLGLVSSDSGLYLEQGRDALLKYLSSSPELNQPGHEWSHYRLAMIYKQLDNAELAKLSAQNAISSSPQNTKVAALVNAFLTKLS